jgi:hypothetical protein
VCGACARVRRAWLFSKNTPPPTTIVNPIEGIPKDSTEVFCKIIDVSAKEIHEVISLPEGSYCLVGQIQGSVRAMQQASLRVSVCSLTDGSTLSTSKCKLGARHGISCRIPIVITPDTELHMQLRSLSVLHTKLRTMCTLYKLPNCCNMINDTIIVRVPKIRRSWSHIHHMAEVVCAIVELRNRSIADVAWCVCV